MRAYLGFMRHAMDRPLLPALLAQDAAGPGDAAGDTGSFVLAAGFPRGEVVAQAWASRDMKGAVVGSMNDEPHRSGALGVIALH